MFGIGARRQVVQTFRRRVKREIASAIESLESRELLTTFISERDFQTGPYYNPVYDFSSDVAAPSANISGGSFEIDGFVGRNDVDFLALNLSSGQKVHLEISDEPFESSFIDGADNVGAGGFTRAGTPTSPGNGKSSYGVLTASGAAQSAASFDYYSNASGSVSISDTLFAGSGNWDVSASVHGLDDTPRYSVMASASAYADIKFLTNRSGTLLLGGNQPPADPNGLSYFRNTQSLSQYDSYLVQMNFSVHTLGLDAADGNATSGSTGQFTWSFTPDPFTPTLGIFNSAGQLLAQGSEVFDFRAPASGSYRLGIAHAGQFSGTTDVDASVPAGRSYYRPYHATVQIDDSPLSVTVTAQYNDYVSTVSESVAAPMARAFLAVPGPISSDQFGPFLPGVGLLNTFTVQVLGDGSSEVSTVTWTIGEKTGTATRIAQSNEFSFQVDMADFTAGSHAINVQAKNSSGTVVEEFAGAVIHTNVLNFELQVDPGAAGDPLDSESIRFFKDITANVALTGTVDGLGSFYRNQVQVLVGPSLLNVTWEGDPGQLQRFSGTRNVGNLSLGTTDVNLTVGGLSVTRFGDTLEHLKSVALPTWLVGGTKTYNSVTGEYEFHDTKPALLDYRAALPKTGQKWLDTQLKKLKTFVTVATELNIDAPLQVTDTVDFSASKITAEAELLGQTIFDETFTSDELAFGGTLDSLTLDPTGFSVRLKDPIEFDSTFLDQKFSFNLLSRAGVRLPESVASAKFELALKILGTATLDAGILITKEGSSIEFAPSGTFVTITASPQGTAEAALTAKVAGGWLADFDGRIESTGTLTITGTVRFSGGLLTPKIDSATLSAKFKLEYRIRIHGTLAKKLSLVDYDSGSEENGGTTDDVFGPYELLTISKKR